MNTETSPSPHPNASITGSPKTPLPSSAKRKAMTVGVSVRGSVLWSITQAPSSGIGNRVGIGVGTAVGAGVGLGCIGVEVGEDVAVGFAAIVD